MKIWRNCREVTQLVLQSQDKPTSALEKGSLRVHWLVCENCRRFRQQQALTRAALDRWKADKLGE
jgi:hypothetical protein